MKTKLKKLLASTISAVMLLSSFSAFAIDTISEQEGIIAQDLDELVTTFAADSDNIAFGKCGDNLTWILDNEGTLTISGTGSMTNYGKKQIDGRDITTAPWGEYADILRKLVINEGITNISTYAFLGCNTFTGNLIIPNSVTEIDSEAFKNCNGFTGSLEFPDSVTKIGYSAFYNCSGFNGNLVIPDNVTVLGYYAFYNCSSLTGSLIIPNGITKIGDYMFANCSSFSGDIIIPKNIMSIGNQAFGGCSGVKDMYIPRIEGSITTGNFPNRVHWKYDLSKCTASIKDYTCTGNAIIPNENSITVTSPNGKMLYYGTDYVINSVKNNINIGTATARIAPPEGGISILSQDVPFNIIGIDLSGATVTFQDDITYQGELCCPEPTVIVNGKTLTDGIDYIVEYSDNNAVGTGKATITGIGNYIGNVNAEFEIGDFKPPQRASVSITERDIVNVSVNGTFVYDGTAKEPKPVIVYHFTNQTTGVTLDYDMVEGTDYEIISYTNNINAGIARIKIRGINSFKDETTVTFGISPCELFNTAIADIQSYEYCKKDICPNPEIKIGDKVMKKDVDYELSYENNRNSGTATVTITGKGNLSGTVTKTFEITPRDGSQFTYYIILT